jgi:hypothetical protein
MASVQLVPADASDASQGDSSQRRDPFHIPVGGVVQTGLDGSFTLSNISPGSYYVLAEKPGYVSPNDQDKESTSTQPQSAPEKSAATMPKVDVAADQTADVDIRLERGAAVSGTIRFDDGSPVAGSTVILLRKIKNQWEQVQRRSIVASSSIGMTDDLGQYRLSGLDGREYVLQCNVTRFEFRNLGPIARTMDPVFSYLSIYSGGTARRRDATPFRLGPGEERTAEDITIPLGKLRTVSGVVTAERDGHVINGGSVLLTDPDDKVTVVEGQIEHDGIFRFEFVPEGNYILRVTNAADKESVEITVPTGTGTHTTKDEKILHTYGDLEQPMKVEGDVTHLVLAVPEAKQAAAAKVAR